MGLSGLGAAHERGEVPRQPPGEQQWGCGEELPRWDRGAGCGQDWTCSAAMLAAALGNWRVRGALAREAASGVVTTGLRQPMRCSAVPMHGTPFAALPALVYRGLMQRAPRGGACISA
jgi:hypothetical protein